MTKDNIENIAKCARNAVSAGQSSIIFEDEGQVRIDIRSQLGNFSGHHHGKTVDFSGFFTENSVTVLVGGNTFDYDF